MEFKEFAEYLEKLEGTSSRLAMTEILARLLSEVTPAEARIIAYLTQGKLGPAYKSPDFGVADKVMIKALNMIEAHKKDDALEIFKRTGDLGRTAEEMLSKNDKSPQRLDVNEVYERLQTIAQANGTGSQDRKQVLIKNLMEDLDPVAAKYAVKIILGKMRTGFSDMTVLDGLSWALVGDKSLRPAIERIYNVRADLGEVAEMVKKYKSPEKIRTLEVDPEIGTPILMAKAERAVSPKEIWTRLNQSAVEYKLDGLRIQAHMRKGEVQLFSRGLENMTVMFPEVVAGLKNQIKKDCIVEGETIAVGPDGKFLPFQETMQRKRKYNINEMAGKMPLSIYLFEVLKVGDKNVIDEPNEKRREILEKLVKVNGKADCVKLMPRIVAKSVKEIDEYFWKALGDGTEGIIAKKLDGNYQAGARNFSWIKYKKSYDKSALADTIDAVVMGYDAGQGKRSGFGIGDFLIGVFDRRVDKFVTIAKIGTGLTDEEWRKMKLLVDSCQLSVKPESYDVPKGMEVDVWSRPKIVVEIQADEITRSPMHSAGVALRFPRLVSWREKQAEDATTLTELMKLFEMQKK